MHTIRFRDGNSVSWPVFRSIMMGTTSPQAAVAKMRREPAGAYDSAPRRRARDQETGGLSGAYVRASAAYLQQAGLPEEDVAAVKHRAAAAETPIFRTGSKAIEDEIYWSKSDI